MASKKASGKKAAAAAMAGRRLTDEEVAVLIKRFVDKLPNASMQAVTKEIRAMGKSVSGGRVRNLWPRKAKRSKAMTAAA